MGRLVKRGAGQLVAAPADAVLHVGLNGFEGGAHIVDLGKRETAPGNDRSNWMIETTPDAAADAALPVLHPDV